jgi:glycosyltransferase involved in cell wall biosynthesis
MRILIAPRDAHRQTVFAVRGLRACGYDASGFFDPFEYDGRRLEPDYYIPATEKGNALQRAQRVLKAARLATRFDVYHFITRSVLRGYLDAKLARRLGKGTVVEFMGTDARIPEVEMERNPYLREFKGMDGDFIRRRLAEWAPITAGHAIFMDHAFDVFLKPYFDHVHVVGQRIDTSQSRPSYPDPERKRPRVLHAPTHRPIKGTLHLTRAVERLKQRGLKFDYVEIEGVPNWQLLDLCADADLIIDQLLCGSHGVFAAECMALGKPVISFIHEELVPTYPEGFPIINANPDTIEAVLEQWIQQPEERHRIGVQARDYAERVHDFRAVGSRLSEVYRRVLGQSPDAGIPVDYDRTMPGAAGASDVRSVAARRRNPPASSRPVN